jgi:hypothetical protein
LAIKRTSSNSLVNATKMSTGFSSAAIPNAPTIGTATATSDVAATVEYTAAVLGATGTTFTATSNPSSITGTGSSPITVTGLTASTSYTFTVTAGNANGTSAASSASNSITTLAPSGSYESIATITSNTSGTITFSNIPQGFKHLQLRTNVRSVVSGYSGLNYNLRVGNGSIDSGSNYTYHRLFGNGATANADGGPNETAGLLWATASNAGANMFAPSIVDILDYTNTTKFKTMRSLSGSSINSGGNSGSFVWFQSFLWRSTSAINTIEFSVGGGGTTNANSHFALYGIKG